MKGDGAVSAESLRNELLALAGVAEAEVEMAGEAPTGVHIRLGSEGDAEVVCSEVQRILAAQGMRSRVAVGPGAEPPPSPVPPVSANEPPPPSPPGPVTGAQLTGELESVRVDEGASGVIVTATSQDGRTETLGSAILDSSPGDAPASRLRASRPRNSSS